MSLTPAMIDALLAAGGTAEQFAALMKADLAEQEAKREAKRAGNAVRQQRHRDKRASRVSNADNALRDVTPPIDRTHTPPDILPDGKNQVSARRNSPTFFVKPEWAADQAWADFLKNRKRKRLPDSATAYAGFLADIDRLADDDWPPGRLLHHAAAKGWGSINDPRETANGRSHQNIQPSQPNGPDKRSGLARALDRELERGSLPTFR